MVELDSDSPFNSSTRATDGRQWPWGGRVFVLVEVVEVEVESDRPIRSSVIVTAYLSRKKSRNPKLDAEVGRKEKSKRS